MCISRKRVWGLFAILVFVFLGFGYWLYRLTMGGYLQVDTVKNQYTVSVAITRGTIYDRKGQPLVNEHKQYRAAIAPNEGLLNVLQPAMSVTAYRSLLQKWPQQHPIVVTLEHPVGIIQGIRQFLVPVRYRDNQPAVHLIGYLDGAGRNGVTGLEKSYNEILSRYCGEISASFTVDGRGFCLRGVDPMVKNTLSSTQGGLQLTINKEVQEIVELTTAEFLKKGAVVILDPCDGAILAMASYPTFNPNAVQESIDKADSPLINRALSLYDCGSVFKMVTAAAALKTGISTDQKFTCLGSLTVGNTVFHCHHRIGHQQLDMSQAMAQSCNLYFIQLAHMIGAAPLYEMIKTLELSESLCPAEGLVAPASVLPSLSYLEQSPAALGNLSFGQGKLLVSPLHVAMLTTIMANQGRLVTPYLIKGFVNEAGECNEVPKGRGEQVIDGISAKSIQEMLEKVVEEGTGQRAAPAYAKAAGKTGTAETGQRNVNGLPVVQSWFTGYVPADNPQYVITVLAEDAKNTNADAARLFCEISNKLLAE